MSIKILATADLHLGKRSSDIIEEYASTKYTLKRIVDYCMGNSIDILVLCGDIVDWDNRFFEAYGPLQDAFDRLAEYNIQVYLVAGNHDYGVLPQIIKTGNNGHVHLLGQNEKWEVRSFTKGSQVIQFIGWSFANRYVDKSPMQTWDASPLDSNFLTIGLLHGDVDAKNSKYAPIRLDELQHTNVDLWLLGHIHKPQRLADKPIIWYTGSPQALSAKEPDVHGPLLITVLPEQPLKIEKVGMSPVRYEYLSIDVAGVKDEMQFRERVIFAINKDAEEKLPQLEEVRSLVYHIKLIGKSGIAQKIDYWKQFIVEYNERLESGTRVSVRKVDSQLKPEVGNLVQLAQQASPAGMLANTILAIEDKKSTPFLDKLIEEWHKKVKILNQVGAYSPLSSDNRLIESVNEKALISIKEECNRLLSELLNQKEKVD